MTKQWPVNIFSHPKLLIDDCGHLMWRIDSFEKTLMRGKIEGRRRGEDRGWDGTREAPWQHQYHIITRTRLCLYWSIFLHPLGSHPPLRNPPSPGLWFRFITQGLFVRPWTRSLYLGLYIWEMGRVIGAITNRNKWAYRHLKSALTVPGTEYVLKCLKFPQIWKLSFYR